MLRYFEFNRWVAYMAGIQRVDANNSEPGYARLLLVFIRNVDVLCSGWAMEDHRPSSDQLVEVRLGLEPAVNVVLKFPYGVAFVVFRERGGEDILLRVRWLVCDRWPTMNVTRAEAGQIPLLQDLTMQLVQRQNGTVECGFLYENRVIGGASPYPDLTKAEEQGHLAELLWAVRPLQWSPHPVKTLRDRFCRDYTKWRQEVRQ
jgi:hypothetical protein